jgi:transcriptional regulator with XRE-family HTH domain
MDVGRVMREARHGLGISQRHLARRVGIAPSTLSRYESSRQLPSLGLLDRVLAECGKDVRLVLVERHADLDGLLTDLASRPYADRVGRLLSPWVTLFLEHLLRCGAEVQVGGSWAAALHGVPVEPADGRLLAGADDEAVVRLAAALRGRYAQLQEEGGFFGVELGPPILRRHPEARWFVRDVGTFTTRLVPAGEPWPAAERVDTPDGPLRVVPATNLGLDDGVQPEVLDRWVAVRAKRAPRAVPWRRPLSGDALDVA